MKNTVIITGAGSGIGRSASILLSKKGYNLVLIGRSEFKLIETNNLLSKNIISGIYELDISNEISVQNCFNYIFENHKNIVGLVNCAGVISPIEENFELDINNIESRRIIDTNIFGTLNTNRIFINNMIRTSKSGSIVNISSISSFFQGGSFPTYALTKGGIESLTKALASRYGKNKIRINCILPGVVQTPMSYYETPDFDKYVNELSEAHPLKRIGKPNDVALLIAFLISQDSEWMTGQNFIIDGGYSLN